MCSVCDILFLFLGQKSFMICIRSYRGLISGAPAMRFILFLLCLIFFCHYPFYIYCEFIAGYVLSIVPVVSDELLKAICGKIQEKKVFLKKNKKFYLAKLFFSFK